MRDVNKYSDARRSLFVLSQEPPNMRHAAIVKNLIMLMSGTDARIPGSSHLYRSGYSPSLNMRSEVIELSRNLNLDRQVPL